MHNPYGSRQINIHSYKYKLRLTFIMLNKKVIKKEPSVLLSSGNFIFMLSKIWCINSLVYCIIIIK